MAHALESAVAGFTEFGEATQWQESADSHLAYEQARLRRKYGPGGAWSGTELHHALASVSVFILVQQQHVSALATLTREHVVAYSLAPIARSIHELAGRVAWLLDTRIGSRKRAARSLLGEIEDYTRAKTAAYALGHPHASTFGQRLRTTRRVVVAERFYPSEIEHRPDGELVLSGQRLPGLRESLRVAEEVAQNPWNAGGMYDYLSNAAHPTLHTALEMIGLDVADDGRVTTAISLQDLSYPQKLVRNACLAFLESWALHCAYLGLDYELPRSLGRMLPEPGE